ncbi:hypothetical protein CYY_002832 [Polysphondylium violaceum]|uniref:C2H2-type domain-containing protein n=1 Tax=Polysphondylium violaceum TaxID=133409 RepID=A0A8J4PXV6_9MYCE|nr:hypothetical protein CYY_002832 [Polysphondylium violaceum]
MKEGLVVFVLGTTGVGKSQLAIELAQQFDGEVISSDSMQMYRDVAEITTNKVTREEMQGIPHHMLSFLDLETLDFNVGQYTLQVIPIIDDIISRGKLPIVVGGTHYYTTSMIWSNSIISYDNLEEPKQQEGKEEEEEEDINTELYSYEKLKEIDPVSAEKIHKNDFRKIKRSLSIFYTTGKRQSEIYKNQQTDKKDLRYRSCLIWLKCSDAKVMEERLNQRVDKMIERGMIQEITSLFSHPSMTVEKTENFTKGVCQSIGIKELYPYYKLKLDYDKQMPSLESTYNQLHLEISTYKENLTNNSNTSGSLQLPPHKIYEFKKVTKKIDSLKKNLEKELKTGILLVKSHTKRYAHKQSNWIQKLSQNRLDMLHLDTLNLNDWSAKVLNPSKELVEQFKLDLKLTGLNINSIDQSNNNNNNSMDTEFPTIKEWKKYKCIECDKELNGEHEWKAHIDSKSHSYRLKKRKAEASLDFSFNNDNSDTNKVQKTD